MGLSQGLILSRASRTSEKMGSLRSGEFKAQLPAGLLSKNAGASYPARESARGCFYPAGLKAVPVMCTNDRF